MSNISSGGAIFGTVFRVASDGTVTNLGDPPQAPSSFAGDIDRNGIYFIHTRTGSGASSTSRLFKINVTELSTATDNGTPIVLSDPNFEAADIAFNPLDDRLYAIRSGGGVSQIDPITSVVTPFTTTYTDGSALQTSGGCG